MPPRFHSLIATQFVSALADNALLVVAIALLQRSGQPAWWTPLLKFFFIVSYVVLAPLVGALADAQPKPQLMAWMNGVKLGGALALAFGAHPLLAFGVIGFGAAAYAPAKYGLITEWVGAARLVAANAWLEVSVVGAILLGTAAGGFLVSDGFTTRPLALALDAWAARHGFGAAASLAPAFAAVLALYGLSTLINLRLRGGAAAAPRRGWSAIHPLALWREFDVANRALWADTQGGRLSLAITTLFWGAAAVLQFAVLRWATDRLGLTLAGAAYLQAAVALGLIAGAWFAGRRVALQHAPRVLLAGPLLGLLVALGPWLDAVAVAAVLLAVIGAVGGVLMVPMNALLQHRGCQLLSPGRSIAVQGFNENVSVLAMLAAYAATVWLEVPIAPLMTGFGLAVAAAMAWLAWRLRAGGRRAPNRATAPVQVLKGRSNSGL
ncbi:MAG TPA: lysophospholipid transporter LplT [Burkholderiaceae bacterium]|nr:lysophospholipid transporter LplT [Burkholderiaceae bacterium]